MNEMQEETGENEEISQAMSRHSEEPCKQKEYETRIEARELCRQRQGPLIPSL